MAIRIGLVHPLLGSIEPVESAFTETWPEAELVSLYDRSLYIDFQKWREVTPEIARRCEALIDYSVSTGADGILFVGSLFGEPVERHRETLSMPVLTAYEAMIEAAVAAGARLVVMATVADALPMIARDTEKYAAAQGREITLKTHHVEGAMDALQAGDRARHDALIAQAADAMTDCDALMLGQHSMGPARKLMADVAGRQILSSPDTAAAKLKELLTTG